VNTGFLHLQTFSFKSNAIQGYLLEVLTIMTEWHRLCTCNGHAHFSPFNCTACKHYHIRWGRSIVLLCILYLMFLVISMSTTDINRSLRFPDASFHFYAIFGFVSSTVTVSNMSLTNFGRVLFQKFNYSWCFIILDMCRICRSLFINNVHIPEWFHCNKCHSFG
jgi:hypothetical protein